MRVKGVYDVRGVQHELTVERDIEKWSEGHLFHTFNSLGKKTYGEKANLLKVENESGEVVWCENCGE